VLFQQSTQVIEHVGNEGWVQEDDIKWSVMPARQPGTGVSLNDAGPVRPQDRNVFAQHGDGLPRLFDKDDSASPARQGLQAKSPRPSEQIEAMRAGEAYRKPVEQRLANPLRSRAQTRHIRHIQQTTAPVSRYNTQPSRSGIACLFPFRHRFSVGT